MSQYSINLSGVNQKVIVGTATYTAQTTYAAFVASAADGEVGVFLDDGTRRTTALTSGLRFFVAQKRDGSVNKTPVLAFDDIIRRLRTPYSAPVAKVMALGYHPTANPSATFGLDFTGASATNTLTIGVAARDLTPGNQPFPVQEGYTTVNSTTANQYAVLSDLVKNLMGSLDYENVYPDRFVRAEILQSSTTTAITVATSLAVTTGQNIVTFNSAPTGAPAIGGYLAIGGTGQLGDVYRVIGINGTAYTLDRPYTGSSNAALAIANVLNAPFVSGTSFIGLRFTGLSTDYIYTVQGLGTPSALQTSATVVTQWVLGSGAGSQIRYLEGSEGIIFDGVGSTRNTAFREDYGQPTLIASNSGTYDQIFIDLAARNIPSSIPVQVEQRLIQRVLIAAPSGGTLNSTLQTVFGV
jgi:hypothetical protein